MAMTHGRREQLAREKGFRSYREYRAAPASEREAATRRLAARDPSYAKSGAAELAAQPERRRGRQQVFKGAEGRTAVRSTREVVLQSQLRKAADRGQQVIVRATVNAYAGDPSVTKTMELFTRGGWNAGAFLRLVEKTKRQVRKFPQPGGVRSAILTMAASGVGGYGDAPGDLTPADVRDVQMFFQ